MSSIIQVTDLSKTYTISHEGQEKYTALRDVVSKHAKKIFSFPAALRTPKQIVTKEEFWALKDVDFNVEKGDRVGIIGRNGAGKSTLLKILSRITEPTHGEIKIKGRVASLLEVGTGFHPELTGRENVFLNGAVLGMSRAEIKRKFDEIVDFAEVEKFLDTPVKRYSSGMYVRLAFAVAAHLEPEILIVDEVLAVGDAQFQKKCLGKMEDVSKNEGRTVIFVSHNLSSLINLCNASIVLSKGELLLQSSIEEGVRFYQSSTIGEAAEGKEKFERSNLVENKNIQFKLIEFEENTISNEFGFTLKVIVVSKYRSRVGINIFLKDAINTPIGCGLFDNEMELIPLHEGENSITLKTKTLSLAEGNYKLSAEIVIPGFERFDKIENAITFELSNEQMSGKKYRILQEWGYGSMEVKFYPYTITG